MKEYNVVFAPEAEAQLAELYGYISERSSANVALSCTSSVVDYCATLKTRGIKRDDLRPGLRITNYKGNAVITFAVDDIAMTVSIVGVFYGGPHSANLNPYSKKTTGITIQCRAVNLHFAITYGFIFTTAEIENRRR